MKISSVLFTENCISNITNIINQHKIKTEIGGSLVGYQQDEHLIITHASDPGGNAKMSFNSIEIDGEYVTRFCDRLNKISEYKLYFLGDWHTHLSDSLYPSQRDLVAMKHLSNYTPYEYRDSLITVIINHYNPVKIEVYSLCKDKKLKSISHFIVPNPSWIEEFI